MWIIFVDSSIASVPFHVQNQPIVSLDVAPGATFEVGTDIGGAVYYFEGCERGLVH